ncbi:MAG TPA: DUF2793 domain-containing protein [Sphingobium sp.]
MADETSARLTLPLIHAGQAQEEVAHNESLALLDMLVQAAVESADVAAPPGAPGVGQCWIIDSGASGAWAGKSGMIAGWTTGGWRFAAPVEGMRAWVADRGHAMLFDGGDWADENARADGYYVDGQQVVAGRQASIANPAGGSVIDSEARAAIAAIIAALRSHGLVEI